MSEKRFSATLSQEEIDIMPYVVSENDGEVFYKLDGVVDLLNEQQATIQSLKSDKAIAEDYANLFEKENVKLRKQIGEQQATICKLQDLCGKSDGENMKLRNEIKLLKPTNVEQYEQIVQLQEENEQLKNKLNSDL